MAPKKAGSVTAKAKAAPASDSGKAQTAPSKSKGETKQKPEAKGKPNKADRKQVLAEFEAQRRQAADAMLLPPSDDETSQEEEEPASLVTAEGKPKSREQKELEKEFEARARAEAQERRAEKILEREREREKEREKAGKSKDDALKVVLEKVERVGAAKLSNKEKRLYQKHLDAVEEERREQEAVREVQQLGADAVRLQETLRDFSVSVPSSDTSGADLRIENFSISAGGQRLFDEASLTLAHGRRYGFMGPNGQGKTTLLRHLAARKLPVPERWSVGIVEQEAAATETPVVDEVLAADVRRRRLLAEEAELLEKLEADDDDDATAMDQLCARLTAIGDELEATGAEAAEARVRQILYGLGFTTYMADGPVSRLSGGWRMRVSLAKALFLEPDLLLLDEPTNHLDLDAVLWLDEYLCSYKKTIFVVSHDADFVDSVCTDIVHLESKRLQQYRGGYTQFKKAHKLHVKELEKEFKKQQEDKKSGKNRSQEEYVEKPKDYVVKFHFFPPQVCDEMAGIAVNDASFSYSGVKPWLLDGLNFRVDTSTRVAVVGPNGAGKSTLLNLIAKVVEPSAGEVHHTRRLAFGRYSQHFDEIAPSLHMSAVEFLTSPELRRFGAGTANPELAHKFLGQFGLPSHAHTRPMRELSGGQKARVCFASITCRKPEILILDEPTNHLDVESVEALVDALKKYPGGLLLVSHDACLIQAAQCDLWVCRSGEPIRKAASFDAYRREVLLALAKRQAQAEADALERARLRKQRRDQTLQRRNRSS